MDYQVKDVTELKKPNRWGIRLPPRHYPKKDRADPGRENSQSLAFVNMGRMATWAGLSQPLDHLGGPDQSPQDNAEPATRGVGRGFFFCENQGSNPVRYYSSIPA
jgi:hypothetical protein